MYEDFIDWDDDDEEDFSVYLTDDAALPARAPMETVDSETAVLRLTPSSLEEHTTYDAATAILTLTPSSIELHEHACFAGSGVANLNWTASADYRWDSDANMRWEAYVHNTAGWC